MPAALEPLAQTIKAARESKDLSQRALAAKTGVPQSHISKIETGAVDLQASSLIEIARALDLELMLIPRVLLTAIQTMVRGAEPKMPSPLAPLVRESLDRLARKIKTKVESGQPSTAQSAALRSLTNTISELRHLRLEPPDAEQVQKLAKQISRALDVTQIERRTPTAVSLQSSAQKLQTLRNTITHRMIDAPSSAQPAYRLDEDDSDG
jgi:transcriptional regulator with XRE-family HTH domain